MNRHDGTRALTSFCPHAQRSPATLPRRTRSASSERAFEYTYPPKRLLTRPLSPSRYLKSITVRCSTRTCILWTHTIPREGPDVAQPHQNVGWWRCFAFARSVRVLPLLSVIMYRDWHSDADTRPSGLTAQRRRYAFIFSALAIWLGLSAWDRHATHVAPSTTPPCSIISNPTLTRWSSGS